MNRQLRSDRRSLMIHLEVAQKLLKHPEMWEIPERNLKKWLENGCCNKAYTEWKKIFESNSRESILKLISEHSELSTRLRSSSPFVGILSLEERNKYFYNKQPIL